jgi:hypothetical protein
VGRAIQRLDEVLSDTCLTLGIEPSSAPCWFGNRAPLAYLMMAAGEAGMLVGHGNVIDLAARAETFRYLSRIWL